MDLEEHETPQKFRTSTLNSFPGQSVECGVGGGGSATPRNNKLGHVGLKGQKALHCRTPKAGNATYSTTSLSGPLCVSNAAGSTSMQALSTGLVQTPPAKRYHKVKNPFEAALAERLHLPLIASPSLFQRPATPQMSSTQFEWTIDEVSSLKPANVEPHETQFQDSPDPELEAKAQSAISSYFKEQQIVPSPIDCPLRSHRIILSELNSNTPLPKSGRRIRDCASQTMLTFPSVLPSHLEELLQPYFQPQLAAGSTELTTQCPSYSDHSFNVDAKDTSLRRKLFDMHNVVVVDNEGSFPVKSSHTATSSGQSSSSPASMVSLQHTAIVGKLSDSLDKSSFGSLSPISASDGLSPANRNESATKRKSRLAHFLLELDEVEQLSPIHPPIRRKTFRNSTKDTYRTEAAAVNIGDNTFGSLSCAASGSGDQHEQFTPERSSSPLLCHSGGAAGFSTDSFNLKVSRLVVNSSKCSSAAMDNNSKLSLSKGHNVVGDVEFFNAHNETDEGAEDDENMQFSQLSAQSSNCSSSNSDTPRSKRRSASRKNLSRSFSANWLEDGEEEEAPPTKPKPTKQPDCVLKSEMSNQSLASFAAIKVNKNGADSGFNEMHGSSTYDAALAKSSAAISQEAMMVCCSTPSKRDNNSHL